MRMTVEKSGEGLVGQVVAEGSVVYEMKAIPAMPTKKKYTFFDGEGKAIGTMKRTKYSFGIYKLPRYFLQLNDGEEVELVKKMEQLTSKYAIKGGGIDLEGTFLGSSFSVKVSEKKYADVFVKQEGETFIFDIEIEDESENHLLIGFLFTLSLIYYDERNFVRA